MSQTIPKAIDLYTDDVNKAIIKVQQITGVPVDDEWWEANVGNEGTHEEILQRFDAAYALMINGSMSHE